MVRLLVMIEYYFVYVLKSKEKDFIFVGFSKNYKQRIKQHNKGQVQSTKNYLPCKLIDLEIYTNRIDAKRRKNYLKTTKGRTTLKSMLKETLK